MLQLFIYFDVFLLGIIAAIATRHAYAHFRPDEHQKADSHRAADQGHLPPAVKEQLLQKAQTRFNHAVEHSAQKLEEDLKTTEENLTKQLDKLGSELISKEMARYKEELAKLQERTSGLTEQAATELTTHQGDLKTKMQAELAAEKQRVLAQIDSKLTDAVMSFLLDTLQHNIDLGAQSAYLTSMLEEHKNDFKQGVVDETPAAG